MPKRVTTIAFDDRADSELEHLATDLQETKAGVIRNALALYAFLKNELADSNRILAIVEGDQVQTRIAVPGLEVSHRAPKTRPTGVSPHNG